MVELKFRIAIVGGGIAGLTLAIALTQKIKYDHLQIHIDLYESAKELSEIGAGVSMMRRPWQIMERIGLGESLRELCHVPDIDDHVKAFEFRKSDQLHGLHVIDMVSKMGILTFHRAEFQKTLASYLDSSVVTTHFNKRLISYNQPFPASGDTICPGQVMMVFKDGTTAACDILVGADGIHSVTRRQMYQDMAREVNAKNPAFSDYLLGMREPEWSGTLAYRGVIPREQLESLAPGHKALDVPVNWIGKDKHIVTYPISAGRLINVIAFISEPEKEGTVFEGNEVEVRSQQEMLAQYEGWEDEAIQVLQCVEKPSRWAINQMKGLPSYTHGRVCILGDSAHAMTTHIGQGGGQGIEDAYILTSVLCHPLTNLQNLHMALEAYDAVRRPKGNRVVKMSSVTGHLYELNDPRFVDIPNNAQPSMDRLKELGHVCLENWRWVWTTDAEDDRLHAVKIFEEKVMASE